MIEAGLDDLRREYVPPRGRFYLAIWTSDSGIGHIAGCGGFRPLDDVACQLMRVYVRPESRRRGVGRGLLERLFADARKAGFRAMRAEALPSMRPALSLFDAAGFAPTGAWHDVPEDWGRWVFREKALA